MNELENKLNQKVYDVLEQKYPGQTDFDRLKEYEFIGEGTTFGDMLERLNESILLGPYINEKVFKELAEIIDTDYEVIRHKWNMRDELPDVEPGQKADDKYIKSLVEMDGSRLSVIDDKYKSDPELTLIAVRQCFANIQYSSPELINNKSFVIEAIKQSNYFTMNLRKYLDDKDVMLEAVKKDSYSLSAASDRLKDDKDIILAAVNNGGIHTLSYASERLRDDKEVVLTAVIKNPESLQYASDRLKDSELIVKTAMDRHNERNPLQYASERLRTNPELLNSNKEVVISDREKAMEAIREDHTKLKYVDKSLLNNKDFIMDAVKVTVGIAIEYTSDELKKDADVVLASLSRVNINALETAGAEIRDNKDFMMKAVAIRGDALYYASDRLKDDVDIVKTAIAHDPVGPIGKSPGVIGLASARIQKHPELVGGEPVRKKSLKDLMEQAIAFKENKTPTTPNSNKNKDDLTK